MHLTFWQNIISPHQAPFLRALAGMGHEVTVVAPEVMTADRLAMGWQAPDLGLAKVLIAPDAVTLATLIEGGPREAIHVLAGARWTPLGHQATRGCLAAKRRMGILTEAPDPRGLGGIARYLKYSAERITDGRHYEFILAMGEMGVSWFRRCGYPPARLFPFAYVTEQRTEDEGRMSEFRSFGGRRTEGGGQGDAIILFVGRLVPLKGVDLLLRAFAAISTNGVRLQVIGDGQEEERLHLLSDTLGIGNRVEWLGRKDSNEIPALMAMADVVVLPSHKDGWGAVVNEALMAGTPVICSTACGAAELIRQPWLGTIFAAGNVNELAAALGQWSGGGRSTPEKRQRIREWSRSIEGGNVARYFVEIMEHVYKDRARPAAPWRRDGA
jgi:glycosyltransferase involved in cell wall biosynthesis